MAFSSQEYWSELPFPSPGYLPDPEIKSGCPELQSDSLCTELPGNFRNEYGGGGLIAKSCPTLATPWTVACQTLLTRRFSRQEYWSELPFPSPWDLPDPWIEPVSPELAGRFFTTEPLVNTIV